MNNQPSSQLPAGRLMVTPTEAARLLSIGRTKIYQLIATGVLPSVHIGRSVRVPVDALRKWIARNSTRDRPPDDAGNEHLA
jgi:excisionase family DNA binding protein